MGEEGFGQIIIKSLIHCFSCSIFGICWGKGLVENVIWERESLLKNRHMIFERSHIRL